MPAGRPAGLTPEVREKILQAVAGGNFRGVAAVWAGVPPRTFKRWCARGRGAKTGLYREFWHALLAAEKQAEIRAVALVLTAAADDPKHAEWWLERKFPERWARRHRVEARVTATVSVTAGEDYERLRKLPYDELLRQHHEALRIPLKGGDARPG